MKKIKSDSPVLKYITLFVILLFANIQLFGQTDDELYARAYKEYKAYQWKVAANDLRAYIIRNPAAFSDKNYEAGVRKAYDYARRKTLPAPPTTDDGSSISSSLEGPPPILVNPDNIPGTNNLPPGNITTFVAPPSITGVGSNNFYFFGEANTNKIYYSFGVLGGGGSKWYEVDGGGLGSSNAAAGVVNNHIYVAIKGMDNSIWLNQADAGGHFSGWASMNFYSDADPSVTGAGNRIYFFAKRTDGRIFYNYAESGAGGVGWKEVNGNAIAGSSPSSAAIGNYVFVAIRGLDNQIYYNQGDGGFGQWFAMNFETNVAPALVAVGQYIYFFGTRVDGHILYNRARLGQAFEGWKEVDGNGLTDSEVSVGSVGNHIFITMKARNGKYYLNQADVNRPFNSFWSLMQ